MDGGWVLSAWVGWWVGGEREGHGWVGGKWEVDVYMYIVH